MLQFTKDSSIQLTAQGLDVPDGQIVTGFMELNESTPQYWLYKINWFLGDYGDYPPSDFIKFDQLASGFKVVLKNDDGTDKYTIPVSSKVNYNRVIEEASYPIQQYIMEIKPDLAGKLNIGGLG